MANDDLRADAKELAELVATLNRSVQGLSGRTRRSEKLIRRVAVSLVLSMLVAGVVVFMGWRFVTFADCQTRQFEAVRDALVARSVASGQQGDAAKQGLLTQRQQVVDQKTFLGTLRTAGGQDEQLAAGLTYFASLDEQIAAIDEQLKAADRFEAAKASNPLSVGNCR